MDLGYALILDDYSHCKCYFDEENRILLLDMLDGEFNIIARRFSIVIFKFLRKRYNSTVLIFCLISVKKNYFITLCIIYESQFV